MNLISLALVPTIWLKLDFNVKQKPPSPINTDHEIFQDAMQDVTPLNQPNKYHTSKQKLIKKQPVNTTALSDNKDILCLSHHEYCDPVAAEEKLNYKASGIPIKRMRQLEKGQISIEDELDLHGYTVEESEKKVLAFLNRAKQKHFRCVRIIHGKGSTQIGSPPILKNKINNWLRDLPQVLAFCSSLPKHGGAGSVYVLLKVSYP